MPTLYEKLAERSVRLLDLYPGELNLPLRVPFTLNVAQALLRLRRTGTVRTLWIDQICINQNDNIERGHQVSLMGDIYRGASVVNIWFGEDSETSEAIAYIPRLLESFSDSVERDETGDWVPHLIQTLGILNIKSPSWIAPRSIFERPYFRRMWIVQEVALEQKCVAYCGTYPIIWDELAKIALCLKKDPDHQFEARRVVRMIEDLKRKHITDYPGHRPLVNLIHQTFNLLFTNPRDKIYGVLGLASDINPSDLIPDYSLSYQEVYLTTTIFVSRIRNPKLVSGMPSWVPVWTATSAVRKSLGFKFSEGYLAVGKNHQHLISIFRGSTYQVFLEWEQYARNVSPYATGETYPMIFWRILVADGGTLRDDSDRTRRELYEAYQNLANRNMNIYNEDSKSQVWRPIAEMSIVNSRSMNFEKLMDASCAGRKIAITEHGFLGLVPSNTQAGDEIAILETARVSVVPRRVSLSANHSFIGECYLQGWMDGT